MSKNDRRINDLRASQPGRQPCIEVVDPLMAAVLRSKTPAERLEIAWGLWRFARDTLRRTVAKQHPEWSDYEVKCEATRRLIHES